MSLHWFLGIWDPWICNLRGDCVISKDVLWLEERFLELNLKRPGPNCTWQCCSHSDSDECLTRRQKVWQDRWWLSTCTSIALHCWLLITQKVRVHGNRRGRFTKKERRRTENINKINFMAFILISFDHCHHWLLLLWSISTARETTLLSANSVDSQSKGRKGGKYHYKTNNNIFEIE